MYSRTLRLEENWAAAGVAPLGVLIVWLAPWGSLNQPPVPPATFAQVQAVIQQRCVMCHNEQVNQKGVMLHRPDLIAKHAPSINLQVVVQRTMPLNNVTQITDAERALIGRWFAAGAPTQ